MFTTLYIHFQYDALLLHHYDNAENTEWHYMT